MITKITKGARVGDIASYLHGPGDRDEHTYGGEPGGMVIGGNLGREGSRSHKGWAADMHHYAKQAKGKKPIWQVSLRNADDDRIMTDDEWSEAGQLFAEEMGYQDRPWVMVRHADDHVHVVLCRQGDDGAMWDDRNDRPRAMVAKSKLEERYGLTQVAVPKTHQAAAERSAHKLTQGEHAKAHRTGETPPRIRLAERVRAARDTAAKAGGREMFEQQLEGLGVEHRATTTKAGEMRGYAFHLPGDVDKDGQPIYYPASKLDRSLSWTKLGPQLDAAPALHEPDLTVSEKFNDTRREADEAYDGVPVPKVKKKFMESKTKHAERVKQQHDAEREQAYDQAVASARLGKIVAEQPQLIQRIDGGLDSAWKERRARTGKTVAQRSSRTEAQQQAKANQEQKRKDDLEAEKQRKAAEKQAQIARERAERQRLDRMFKPSGYSPPSAPQKDDPQFGG